MSRIERVALPVVEPVADANIRRRYALEEAAWIWHPELRVDDRGVVRFANEFELEEDSRFLLHVSGDQRYDLSLDGEGISRGPDRGDLAHWSFATYQMELPAGRHRLEALVWWIGDLAPTAQVSHRGGFILAAEGLEEKLNTGSGNWRVALVEGLAYGPGLPGHYHVIGPSVKVDGTVYWHPAAWVQAAVVDRMIPSDTGIAHPGWQLYPSPLPEQKRRRVNGGRIRAVYANAADGAVPEGAGAAPEVESWQKLVDGAGGVEVAANSRIQAIWDLGDYFCGYSRVRLSGGEGSEVGIEWAESLFAPGSEEVPRQKGNREEVEGKRFWGFGDRFLNDGGQGRDYASLWWRSGRYVRIAVETGEEPLRIEGIGIEETGYPLENEGAFDASGFALEEPAEEEAPVELHRIVPLAVRGIQMCAHETFMDCPYYEQMMYVGDTRLEILTLYTMTRDDRLAKRAIELFDWSRWKTGFVAERYPSHPFQLSLTFSMLWISTLRDYAFWRDDLFWVRRRLVGVRCLLEHFRMLLDGSGLLKGLPGWPFVDWVPQWEGGVSPDGRQGISAPINLLFVQALQDAAALEEVCGEAALAGRNRGLAEQVGERIVELFWDEERGLLADDVEHRHFSEHAQCLALLNEVLSEDRRRRCWYELLEAKDLARTTVYFSFYLFETFRKFGRGDLIMRQMEFWNGLVEQGFKTPVESPEPSRSDCHAWGSHPLFHFHASLAGIRPLRSGFQSVIIAPSPGGLKHIESRLPHPHGRIELCMDMDWAVGSLRAKIGLPIEVDGLFRWRGHDYELDTGSVTTLVI